MRLSSGSIIFRPLAPSGGLYSCTTSAGNLLPRPATGGEIIMALITSSRKQEGISNIGKSAILERGEEYYVNQSFAIISPRTGINPYFLQLSFGADYFLRQLNRYRKPSSKF